MKDMTRLWIAIMLSLFSWLPILNITVILPIALYLAIKQMILIRKEPEEYGGMALAVVCIAGFTILFIMGVAGFVESVL